MEGRLDTRSLSLDLSFVVFEASQAPAQIMAQGYDRTPLDLNNLIMAFGISNANIPVNLLHNNGSILLFQTQQGYSVDIEHR